MPLQTYVVAGAGDEAVTGSEVDGAVAQLRKKDGMSLIEIGQRIGCARLIVASLILTTTKLPGGRRYIVADVQWEVYNLNTGEEVMNDMGRRAESVDMSFRARHLCQRRGLS